jgi:hypothetical protein
MTERSIAHGSFTITRSYSAQPGRVFGAWAKPEFKRKPAPKAKPKADARRTRQGADDAPRRTGHHGGRQRQPSPRARALEGQRYG